MTSKADALSPEGQAAALSVICRYYGGGWTPNRRGHIDIRDRSGAIARQVMSGYRLAYVAQQCQRWLEEEVPTWPS